MNKSLSAGQFKVEERRLRRRAEDRINKELSIKNAADLQDVGRKLYELRIDQIEIELLNEEFNRLREKVSNNVHCLPSHEIAKNGYFFLDREGRICDAKFAGSNSDDASKRKWARHFLSEFVIVNDAQFHEYLHEVFESDTKISCELSFEQAGSKKHLGLKLPLYASINGLADNEKKVCLLVVEDITTRKIAERKKEQADLRRHKQVIGAAMDGFWMINAQGFLEEVNEAYARMSGYSMRELVGMHISQLEVNDPLTDIQSRIVKIIALGYDRFETKHRCKDCHVIDIEVSATFLPESNQFFMFSHDITQRKQAEQALRIAAATFETHDAILITDAQSNIIRVNRAFTEITGYATEEVIGKNPRILSSGKEDKAFYNAMWLHLQEQGAWAGEIWDKRKNGDIYPKWLTITAVKNEYGEITQYVAIFSDITERKKMEEQVRQLAFYDTLTKLPNRRLLNDRLSQTMAASKRTGCYGAVMFLDLDNFKPLNDTYGHIAGDVLLIQAAERLRGCLREMDTVARFGGDEFVVMISELYADKTQSTEQAKIVAEKIRTVLSAPYQLPLKHEGHADTLIEHCCTVSIGAVVFINHEGSQEDILEWADAAMYQAKEAGRNQIRFYDWKN